MKNEPPLDRPVPILEHIEELRKRLLWALIFLLAAIVGSFFFAEKLITVLTQPIGGLERLQSIEVTESIGVYMKVSLLSGFVIAFPVIMYQILRFILPGLTPREKRSVLASIPFITILFLAGVAFTFFIMLTPSLDFLTRFLGIETTPRLSSYINFVTNLIFWVGISFETPLFIFILARFGIVTARGLLKGWRYAVVVIAVIAAVITPTIDPVNMALLMAPLITLYFISVLFAAMAQNRKQKTRKENAD